MADMAQEAVTVSIAQPLSEAERQGAAEQIQALEKALASLRSAVGLPLPDPSNTTACCIL
jgi:hypothetical protein